MPRMYDDTIVAVATAPGEAALGIVRLSGPDAHRILRDLFEGTVEDRMACVGRIRDPRDGSVVDEAVAVAMTAPRTYTREDTAEITCHGSPMALERIVSLAIGAGARPANPGEFTLRAFLNGRIDLAQAESVLGVIEARTDAGLRHAVAGLRGRLSEPIREVRERLLHLQAYLTACIDFPEDEVESQIEIEPARIVADAEQRIAGLLDLADAGMVYRHGVATAIVGRPNVGKSSLLNRLLGEERSIVTDVPGTTRDTVEEVARVEGIPFRLIDTAGMHGARGRVERLGIERSRAAAQRADLLLAVIDTSRPLTEEDLRIAAANGKPVVIVANKADLPPAADLDALGAPAVRFSAVTGEGMADLHRAMARAALGGKVVTPDDVLVTNARHKDALERALAHTRAAGEALAEGTPEDFVTIDLAAALGALGEITGENAGEDLLDRIFSQFCIGK